MLWFVRGDYEAKVRFIRQSFPTCEKIFLVTTDLGLGENFEEYYSERNMDNTEKMTWTSLPEDTVVGLHRFKGADFQSVLGTGPQDGQPDDTRQPITISHIVKVIKLVWGRMDSQSAPRHIKICCVEERRFSSQEGRAYGRRIT